ncbi:undecaprenyl-phosphate galactose phosphotransferase WbaP [Acidithiobacillus ferriphilus]|uniref:undecaprenyl-phosphate galactose phosphotransferase WbaP n=1 Tax=Acidithiobacillus ferriphilus TaxID=1689834 RepID=UPI001E42D069|nr:undecaprenyl-phosphate galactose phosphotransferase WbaP [Acidithiobacillus ferriphilus]UEP59816.1 undecaprenyl-phosphate galactose phosphotransferase WbaP [Acidithiobacillus ferriphilus]
MKSAVSPRARFRWSQWVPYALVLGDVAALLTAFYFGRLSHAFYYHLSPGWVLLHWWGSLAQLNLLLFFLLMVSGITAFAIKGHYARRKAFWDEAGEVLGVFTLLLALNATIAFSGKWPLSRLWLFSTWVLALGLLPMTRWLVHQALQRMGVWVRPVVVIGCGQNAAEATRALNSDPMLGYSVQRVLVPGGCSPAAGSFPTRAPIEALGEDPLATLAHLGNPHVVLALDMDQWEAQERLVRSLGISYPNLTIAPPLRGLPLFGMEIMHFFSHEVLMLRVRDNLARLGPRITKRLFDLMAASLLVVLLSPLLFYIAWRIRREDGGPVFFIQKRVGRQGRQFGCLKFRSMVMDAEDRLKRYLHSYPDLAAEYEINFKICNDPRVTRIGKFLRRGSLDELPQLFNVLRGDMSLVGPRPLLERELDRYGENICLYHMVHPGITGLWQVSGRSETTFDERAQLDAWYVKNWTLWYDIVILLRTVKVVLRREGAY